MEISLQHMLTIMPARQTAGDLNRVVKKVVPVSSGFFEEETITWVSEKNNDLVKSINRGVVICSTDCPHEYFRPSCTYLMVLSPRQYFAGMIRSFFVEEEKPFISDRSYIDASVTLGNNVHIGHGVVLEKNCVVGDNCFIDAGTVIKKGTVIGKHVKIGANNTIGGTGFGYEKNEEGQYEQILHIGNVVIEDHVEIGNNTCIDRAVLGSTVIRKNAKVDNLVHIAHGVEIGENALIIANAMIAGSSVIGKNSWVAPSVSVLNKITIGENAVIGMGAVVIKNVDPGKTVVGNPGRDLS